MTIGRTTDRRAAVLSLALSPIEFVHRVGFALPFGPILGLARTTLIVGGLGRKPLAGDPR